MKTAPLPTPTQHTSLAKGMVFPFSMWLVSRLVVAIALMVTQHFLPPDHSEAIQTGWRVLVHWDGMWYEKIARFGYEYADDGGQHSLAFFPLLPLLARVLMRVGLPFEWAAPLINNLAFLGALCLVYSWVAERQGIQAARWTVAVLAWFPQSLFGTAAYTEGLFLCLSTASLRAFDRHRYGWSACFGALATATRPTGIILIPALLLAAWKERRPAIAFVTALATATGILFFSGYCWLQFHQPLAFVYAQRGWRSTFGFDLSGWLKIFRQITLGSVSWQPFALNTPWQPVLVLVILAGGFLLWRLRPTLNPAVVDYGYFALFFVLWLMSGDQLIKVALCFGSLYLLWYLRHQLSPVMIAYGYCGLGLVLASGSGLTVIRLGYGVVSLAIALGTLFAKRPRWGYPAMGLFALMLVSFTIRFAQLRWIG